MGWEGEGREARKKKSNEEGEKNEYRFQGLNLDHPIGLRESYPFCSYFFVCKIKIVVQSK